MGSGRVDEEAENPIYQQAANGDQSELSQLSIAMVGLHKELFGRGPTKASSRYAGPDMLVTSLEDTMTVAERSMVELGENLRLEETRLFFQRATRDRFVATVQEITGRKVRGFVSGVDPSTDVAAEVFFLEPKPDL